MPTGRPTILQIIPRLDTGGAELSTVEIVEAVVRAGGRALVLTEGGRLVGRVEAGGGEIVPFPAGTKNPARIMLNARRLARLVEAENVDLLHARSRAPAWSALMAARAAERPFVTTYHGAYSETNAVKRLYNGVMARSDIVIANSAYTARLIETRYATPASRVRVVHRGLDELAFAPDRVIPDRIAALRERWRVAPGTRVVLHAARLTGWKGQHVLIAAAGQLARRGALGDAVIVLAGDAQGRGDYVASLERQIAQAGLGGRVRLVGHVDDIPAAFQTAYVAVVASTEPEAFGRAATEAQAMCCPVIATAIGAPPETVLAEPAVAAHQATGWLVPPGDDAALARCLEAALSAAPADHRAMGDRARAHVMANFTLFAMKRSTLAVYDTLLGSAMVARFIDKRQQADSTSGA